MKRGLIFLLPIVVALGTFTELRAHSPQKGSSGHKHQFVKTLGNYKVVLTQVDDQPATGSYWGAFDDIPNTYVDDFSIYYKRVEIYEPMSCYTDLSNVNSMIIVPTKSGLVVKIEGGDASTSYKAQIVVKGKDVLSRSVHDAEMPDDNWEKTTYHDGSFDD